jgi:hypothetical protein
MNDTGQLYPGLKRGMELTVCSLRPHTYAHPGGEVWESKDITPPSCLDLTLSTHSDRLLVRVLSVLRLHNDAAVSANTCAVCLPLCSTARIFGLHANRLHL